MVPLSTYSKIKITKKKKPPLQIYNIFVILHQPHHRYLVEKKSIVFENI